MVPAEGLPLPARAGTVAVGLTRSCLGPILPPGAHRPHPNVPPDQGLPGSSRPGVVLTWFESYQLTPFTWA